MADIIDLFPRWPTTIDTDSDSEPKITDRRSLQDITREKVNLEVLSVLWNRTNNTVDCNYLLHMFFTVLDSADKKRKNKRIRSTDNYCNYQGEDYELFENDSPLRPIFSWLINIDTIPFLQTIINNERLRKWIIKSITWGYWKRIQDEIWLILNIHIWKKNKDLFIEFISLIDQSYPHLLNNPLFESIREKLLASNRRDWKGFSWIQLWKIEKMIGGKIF